MRRRRALLALCVAVGGVAGWLLGSGDVERAAKTRTVTTFDTIVVRGRLRNTVDDELRASSAEPIPAHEALAPAGTSPSIAYVPAAGGVPAQLLAAWSRGGHRDLREYGLAVWQWTRRHRRWRRVVRRDYPFFNPPRAMVVRDLTGDGHQEVWVSVSNGSGGCGPRSVLASVRGRVRSVYESGSACLTRWTFLRRGLRVEDGVAPCGPGSHYTCFHGHRTREYRWNGSRFALVRTRVRCDSPKLDPESGCAPR